MTESESRKYVPKVGHRGLVFNCGPLEGIVIEIRPDAKALIRVNDLVVAELDKTNWNDWFACDCDDDDADLALKSAFADLKGHVAAGEDDDQADE